MKDIEKKHKVFVGIGSNLDQQKNIKECIKALDSRYIDLKLSPVYESSSMGFDGPNFYNLAASFLTNLELVDLKNELNQMEFDSGRKKNEEKYSSRTLDIDILYFDDLVDKNMNIPRSEIEDYDFVLRPLFELDPFHIHSVLLKSHYKCLTSLYKKMISNEVVIDLTL